MIRWHLGLASEVGLGSYHMGNDNGMVLNYTKVCLMMFSWSIGFMLLCSNPLSFDCAALRSLEKDRCVYIYGVGLGGLPVGLGGGGGFLVGLPGLPGFLVLVVTGGTTVEEKEGPEPPEPPSLGKVEPMSPQRTLLQVT